MGFRPAGPPRGQPPLMKKPLVDRWRAADGSWLHMRLMQPRDAPLVKESLNRLSPKSRRNRFFAPITEFSDEAVRQLVDVDPQNVYALVVTHLDKGTPVPVAGGRLVEHPGDGECSFSLLVGDRWQGQRVGRRLLKALLREASRRGLRQISGEVLADNQPMLRLARSLHFVVTGDRSEGVLQIVRDVPPASSQRMAGLLRKVLHRR